MGGERYTGSEGASGGDSFQRVFYLDNNTYISLLLCFSLRVESTLLESSAFPYDMI